MVIDYRNRGVHQVRDDNGLEFQVLTYGVGDPGALAIEVRLEKRGMDARVLDDKSRHCSDTFNFGEGRLPGVRGVEERPQRHFFNRRIDVVQETLQARHDARRVGARDQEVRRDRVQEDQVEERRDARNDRGEQ